MSLVNPLLDILTSEDREPEWLIPNFILQGTMVIYAGDAGAGKSYVSYTLGLAMAAGLDALGGVVPTSDVPKRILYFDEENSPQDREKYLKRSWFGLCEMNKVDPFDGPHLDRVVENFWPFHFVLGGPDWKDQVLMALEQVQTCYGPVHAMFFDTATPCFDIEDENNNGIATQVMKDLRSVMATGDPHITTIILKHAKVVTEKGGRRTIRGAKAWKSGADQLVFQVKAAGRPRRDGLSLTRIEPDKSRAYGLSQPIYITPRYTDDNRTGLALHGSYYPDKAHKLAEQVEDEDE